MADVSLNLPNVAADRCQSPYSGDTAASRTANQKLGSTREPGQVRSPEAKTRWKWNVMDLTCIERLDMNTAKVGICQLFAVRRNGSHVN